MWIKNFFIIPDIVVIRNKFKKYLVFNFFQLKILLEN